MEQCVGDFKTEGAVFNLNLIQNEEGRICGWNEGNFSNEEGNGSMVSWRHLDVCIMTRQHLALCYSLGVHAFGTASPPAPARLSPELGYKPG